MEKRRLPYLTSISSLTIILFSLLGTAEAQAQNLAGMQDSLYSDLLQEQRIIQILLPGNYNPESDERYDVLYLLDGEWQINLASHIQPYVAEQDFMPPSIIIGIINTDRNRDFLPTKMKDFPTSGGADKFLLFLENELIPYVNNRYPTNGENTLFGASFGGLFPMYAFLENPQLFESYLAADPPLWLGNGYLQKLAVERLEGFTGMNKTFYVGGREGFPFTGMGISSMDSVFQLKAPAGILWKSVAYPDETHNSVSLKTMCDGLKFAYKDYRK